MSFRCLPVALAMNRGRTESPRPTGGPGYGTWSAPVQVGPATSSASGRAPSLIVVQVADMKVSADPDTTLITYFLGSCIAVVIYDPVMRVGGMLHYMLPTSSMSPDNAIQRPAMFADTGIPALLHAIDRRGCGREDLIVKAAGGG
jgi:chemotaxis receptor (MCP) glutamine deamidase CheD